MYNFKEKATSLSTVIMIGPPSISLSKPLILIVDHCLENANQNWNISLYTALNNNEIPVWKVHQYIHTNNDDDLFEYFFVLFKGRIK